MLNEQMISFLKLHETGKIMLCYKQNLYPVNSLFMEHGVLYLRSLKLLTDDEKAECDVAYGEEDEVMTGEELIDKLINYSKETQINLNLPTDDFGFDVSYEENDDVIKLYERRIKHYDS